VSKKRSLALIPAGAGRRRGPAVRPLSAGLAAGVLMLAAACGSSSPTPGPAGSPQSPPMSPADFQQALSGVDAALRPDFTAIGAAQTPADLSAALGSARVDLGTQADALTRLTPPTGTATAAGQLAAGLRQLAQNLATIATEATDQQVCTAGTGVPRVGSSQGAQDIRRAEVALNTADPGHTYSFGAFLPAAAADPSRRPGNGDLPGGQRGGNGQLTVDNRGTADAVIKLVTGSTAVRDLFIAAGTSAKVTGIPDGTFDTYLTTGVDWDDTNHRFTRNCGFKKFDDPMHYTTTDNGTETFYSTFTLTLDTLFAPGSAAPDRTVAPSAFPGS
jgi:hypothetical protein